MQPGVQVSARTRISARAAYKRARAHAGMSLHLFTEPLSAANLNARILAWCAHSDASEQPDAKTPFNVMHVLGMKIASDLHALELPDYALYNPHDELGASTPLPFEEPLLSALGWPELAALVGTLQLEYSRLVCWDSEVGFHSCFDHIVLLKFVLKRVGFWVRHTWRLADGAHEHAVLDGTLNVDAAGWHVVSPPSLVHLFDVLHVFTQLTQRLLGATVLHNAEAHSLVPLHPHHHEASLEDFNLNSVIADSPVGSIVQYAHRFQFLFHSVTQVVYFHWPAYRRALQLPIAEIRKPDADPRNLLPLLLQVEPTLAVLHEHTGALRAGPRSDWAWINVAGFFALLGPTGCFVSSDLRTLLLHHAAATSV